MTGCDKCLGFAERINFEHPREYRDIARQLIEVVEQGTFQLVAATCPLQDIVESRWPGDAVEHKFRCAACGRMYRLFADTYHGSARWTPVD